MKANNEIIRKLNIIWKEFVYGNHLTSLAAISVVLTSAILLDIKITWDFLLIIYLASQVIYRYNHYKEFKKDSLLKISEREKHIGKYIKYVPAIIFLFTVVFIAILLFSKRTYVLIIGLFLFVFGLFYSLFFKQFTKRIVAFKGLFVSLWWSFMVIFLAVYYSFSLNLALLLIFIFIFLRQFIYSSFFDIKDIASDKKEKLLTLAIVFGKKKLLHFLYFINLFSTAPIILGVYLNLLPGFSLALLLIIFFTFYYLHRLEKKEARADYYFYELSTTGEKISWSFLTLISRALLC